MSKYWPLFDFEITTPRLQFRYPTDEDVEVLADILQEIRAVPGYEWFWAESGMGPGALDDMGSRLVQGLWYSRSEWRKDKWALNMMASDDDGVVGVVELYTSDFLITRTAELGIWLRPLRQGRGLGTEMARCALQVLFEKLGAEKALWSADLANEGSRAVARKVGFKNNGFKRIARGGKSVDEELFVLDREDWISDDRMMINHFESSLPLFGL